MALRWQRPTLDTRFYIDPTWWDEQGRDMRVYLRELLCDECAQVVDSLPAGTMIDSVDPETGQVQQVDPLWDSLLTCCARKPSFFGDDMPIVDGVFRVLVANGNQPMTVRELHAYLRRRSPEMILRTLTAGDVYLGIRPHREQ